MYAFQVIINKQAYINPKSIVFQKQHEGMSLRYLHRQASNCIVIGAKVLWDGLIIIITYKLNLFIFQGFAR